MAKNRHKHPWLSFFYYFNIFLLVHTVYKILGSSVVFPHMYIFCLCLFVLPGLFFLNSGKWTQDFAPLRYIPAHYYLWYYLFNNMVRVFVFLDIFIYWSSTKNFFKILARWPLANYLISLTVWLSLLWNTNIVTNVTACYTEHLWTVTLTTKNKRTHFLIKLIKHAILLKSK